MDYYENQREKKNELRTHKIFAEIAFQHRSKHPKKALDTVYAEERYYCTTWPVAYV